MGKHRYGLLTRPKLRAGLVPLVAIGLATGVAACGAISAWRLWSDARTGAQTEISNLAVVLARQATLSLQSIDLVLQDLAEELQNPKAPAFPVADGHSDAPGFMHDDLAARVRTMPQTEYLAIVNMAGQLVGSSQSWPVSAADIAATGDVETCRTITAEQPFVGSLIWDRNRSGFAFPLVRCLTGPDGRQLGFVVAGVSIHHLMDLYRTIGLPAGITVAIRRINGAALVRFPNAGPEAPPRLAADQPPGGLLAVRDLEGYPLRIEVGMDENRALAIWHGQIIWIAIGCLFVGLCLFMMAWRFAGLLRRLEGIKRTLTERNRALIAAQHHLRSQAASTEETAQALRESEARLAKQAIVLETTLDHMNQGLMMVTADRQVAVCNRRAIEMLGLPSDLARRRPSFGEILAFQWQTEEFASTEDDVRDLLRAGGILDQAHSYERRRPDGTVLEVCSVPLAKGGIVRTYTDITARKLAEERLTYIAYHDELTGLLNRHALRKHMEEALQTSETGSLALLYLDLDRFKLVNDTLGHMAGDDLLRQVADRMLGVLRPGDMLARLGGDEFAAVLPKPVDEAAVMVQAERLKSVVSLPYQVDGQDVRVGVSVGIAFHSQDDATVDTILRSADSALYRAKIGGRDAICLHESDVEVKQRSRLLLERDLRLALEREQFELLYQPIYDTTTGLPFCCEALIRWRHPTRGMITPDSFIPMAEESGIIREIGRWVLLTACKEAATWALPVRVAVNLSSVQLAQTDLEEQVVLALEQSGLPSNRLDLEVTESVLISHFEQARTTMLALQARGVRLVMDDFGTGHASLEALQGLPFQQLKIDRSFVETLFDTERTGAIIPAILSIAANMRLDVVAEGVSTIPQVDRLRELGCRYLQGYLLACPQPPEWIRSHLWHRTAALSESLSTTRVITALAKP